MSKLTIVLPIHGREEFTPRFLDSVAGCWEVIEAKEQEPGLAGYWAKMVAALAQVKTPYAMVCDNDDFLQINGISLCMEFLDDHPDFIACSGKVQGIWIWPSKLYGPNHHITNQYAPFDTPATYDQFSVNDRVLAGFRNSWSYYAVYRTEHLLSIWQGVQALALEDFMVHEKFCAMEALALGKVKCLETPSYRRQYETSTRNPSIVEDWTQRFQRNVWTRDVAKVLAVMGTHGVDQRALKKAWGNWYADHLYYHFGPWGQWRRRLKRWFPRLAYAWQHTHEWRHR